MKRPIREILLLIWKLVRVYLWKFLRPYLGKIILVFFGFLALFGILTMLLLSAC